MCGIAAILLCPQERTAEQWQAIRKAFTQNLVFNEERGNAATGVAIISADGKVTVHKLPMPASEFVNTHDYRAVLAETGPQTTLILGHTRLPTKGSALRNENNHPIQAGNVFGVHNGNIENDDELFARCGCPREAEVDSEIIFRLIETVSPQALDGSYLNKIRPLLQVLRGQFTFLAFDRRCPERLVVLKHSNPLCLHYHPEWNALIFSSRYIFLRRAFGTSLVAEALDHDHLMLFDAYSIAMLASAPLMSTPLYTRGSDL